MLLGNFEKNRWEVKRSCLVGVAWIKPFYPDPLETIRTDYDDDEDDDDDPQKVPILKYDNYYLIDATMFRLITLKSTTKAPFVDLFTLNIPIAAKPLFNPWKVQQAFSFWPCQARNTLKQLQWRNVSLLLSSDICPYNPRSRCEITVSQTQMTSQKPPAKNRSPIDRLINKTKGC